MSDAAGMSGHSISVFFRIERFVTDLVTLSERRAGTMSIVEVDHLESEIERRNFDGDTSGKRTTVAAGAPPAGCAGRGEACDRAYETDAGETDAVARLIQQTLLPRELPAMPGWQLAAYYQPARAVGGDFYDFLYFDDGRLGIVIGDVTDKGVPAALVMATTRSILRSAAHGELPPG